MCWNIAIPNEDDVDQLDGADDGETVGEAQHAANVGQQRGHAVRLENTFHYVTRKTKVYSVDRRFTLAWPNDAGVR